MLDRIIEFPDHPLKLWEILDILVACLDRNDLEKLAAELDDAEEVCYTMDPQHGKEKINIYYLIFSLQFIRHKKTPTTFWSRFCNFVCVL